MKRINPLNKFILEIEVQKNDSTCCDTRCQFLINDNRYSEKQLCQLPENNIEISRELNIKNGQPIRCSFCLRIFGG